MITLAVLTGVSPLDWAEMGERAIATGLDVLEEVNKARAGRRSTEDDDSKVYSG